MNEFEDKLQAILGNPQAMDQIMSIARSISGNPPSQDNSAPSEELADQSVQNLPGVGDPFALLSGLDPRLLHLGVRLLGEYRRDDEPTVALLRALQPFIRQERYAKVDKALQIAKLSRVIRVALETFRKGDADFV